MAERGTGRATGNLLRRRTGVVAGVTGAALVAQLGSELTPVLRSALVVGLVCLAVVAGRRPRPPVAPDVTGDDPWRLVRWELNRARRHSRPLTLARIPLADPPATQSKRLEIEGALPPLRATDVTWLHRDQLMLLLPEADRARAQRCVDRVVEALAEHASGDARLVAFPEDALTLEALREALKGRRRTVSPVRRHATGDSVETAS
jgi:hypothetical protein